MKILKKTFLIAMILSSALTFSQEKDEELKLTIIVKDVNNKPVPGAIILLDNIKENRVANANGIFKTKLKKSPKEITVFSPTIGAKTVPFNGKSTMIINITKDTNDFISDTNNEKIVDPIQYRNIYDYLRGKVPGVQVSLRNSIIIRGASNFTQNKSPLLILNGVQVDEETFGAVVPTTIQSVKVLKGPETASYGVRGANGVIEVVTMI